MNDERHSNRVTPSDPPEGGRHLARNEGGWVLILFALLLVPLVGFTALAVDLGAWYAHAAQVERAADAAALAGVVFLPDEDLALQEARRVAAKNGFAHDPMGTGVVVDAVNLGNQQLKVTITDPEVNQYFSGYFVDDVDIERAATAEFVLPVRMGSPRNYLGTHDDPSNVIPTAGHENFALAASGPCAGVENGDLVLPHTDANYVVNESGVPANANPGPSGSNIDWQRCTGGNTVANPHRDDEGYFYAIEVPEAWPNGTQLQVQIYDAPHCNDGSDGVTEQLEDSGNSSNGSNNSNSVTRFRLRDRDTTPYEPGETAVLATQTYQYNASSVCGTASSDWQNKWRTLHSFVPANEGGIYFVQVDSYDDSQGAYERHGSNQFSLRAGTSGSWTPCTSSTSTAVTGVAYSATCPNVYASPRMSIYAGLNGSQPRFYLSDIGPEHNGKTLEVDLFDPGEGALAIEILDPLGNPVSFDWEIINGGNDATPNGGWSGSSSNFTAGGYSVHGINTLGSDPLGNCRGWNTQVGGYRGSRSKYSDRRVHLEIQLPDDIAAAYSGQTWWRVRYTMAQNNCGSPTDRTTWTVRVTGDPVRLIPTPP